MQTLLGPMTFHRAYYHCQACGQGFCPRGQAWGFAGTSHSPGQARVLGLTAAHMSFAETRALVWELAGVRVTTQRVERTDKALGQEIAAMEFEVVVPEPPAAPTVHAVLDGTGIPMRPEEAPVLLRADGIQVGHPDAPGGGLGPGRQTTGRIGPEPRGQTGGHSDR